MGTIGEIEESKVGTILQMETGLLVLVLAKSLLARHLVFNCIGIAVGRARDSIYPLTSSDFEQLEHTTSL